MKQRGLLRCSRGFFRGSQGSFRGSQGPLSSQRTVISASASEEKSCPLSRTFLGSKDFSLRKISRFARNDRRASGFPVRRIPAIDFARFFRFAHNDRRASRFAVTGTPVKDYTAGYIRSTVSIPKRCNPQRITRPVTSHKSNRLVRTSADGAWSTGHS